MKFRTDRLELVSGNYQLSRAELSDRGRFSKLLNALVPEWPPPLNDENSIRFALNYYARNPDANGWGVWYFILVHDKHERIVIGNGGFKGKPTSDGCVEVGYSILESYQKQGFGTEALRGLVTWAFRHSGLHRVIAETFPELRSSIRVLEKNGFHFTGAGSQAGSIRYDVLRQEILGNNRRPEHV